MRKAAKKSAVPAKREVVRAVRAELARPVSCSWDELGSLLRLQRSQVHRLANAAALECAIADRAKTDGAKRTVAYRAVGDEIERIREWASGKGVEHLVEFTIPGGTQSAIADMGHDAFVRWSKAKYAERLPTAKKGAPIPLRAQETDLVERDGAIVFRAKLDAATRAERLLPQDTQEAVDVASELRVYTMTVRDDLDRSTPDEVATDAEARGAA